MANNKSVESEEMDKLHKEALDWDKTIDRRVKKVTGELKEKADTDPLTGLFNRRAASMFLDKYFEAAKEIRRREQAGEIERRKDRDKRDLVVIMMDIDGFKNYNDTHGHGSGDEVLIAFGDKAKKALRPTDISVRHGGEEFLFILPETDLDGGKVATETLRMQIKRSLKKGETMRVKVGEKGKEKEKDCKILEDIEVSAGVVALSDEIETVDDLIDAADKALYAAKKAGRDRSAVWMGSKVEPEIITVGKGEEG